jgi:hypothetical protein
MATLTRARGGNLAYVQITDLSTTDGFLYEVPADIGAISIQALVGDVKMRATATVAAPDAVVTLPMNSDKSIDTRALAKEDIYLYGGAGTLCQVLELYGTKS